MATANSEALLLALGIVSTIVAVVLTYFLSRVLRALYRIVEELRMGQEENRVLLRNLMVVVRDSSSDIAVHLREQGAREPRM